MTKKKKKKAALYAEKEKTAKLLRKLGYSKTSHKTRHRDSCPSPLHTHSLGRSISSLPSFESYTPAIAAKKCKLTDHKWQRMDVTEKPEQIAKAMQKLSRVGLAYNKGPHQLLSPDEIRSQVGTKTPRL